MGSEDRPIRLATDTPNECIPLPAELCFMVFSHLRPEDVLSFSACSRYCRALIIPSLLRKIKLGPKALNFFKAGGSLHTECKHVHHITLMGLDAYSDFWDLARLARSYAACLHLFPNITHIRVSFYTLEVYYGAFLSALLLSFSKLEFFTKLTGLDVRKRFIDAPDDKFNREVREYLPKIVEPALLQQTGRPEDEFDSVLPWAHAIHGNKWQELVFPPSLTDCTIVLENTSFSFAGSDRVWSRPNRRLIDPYFIYHESQQTLKRLVIAADSGKGDLTPSWQTKHSIPVVFPNLVYLEVHFGAGQGTGENVRDIASKFPNLEELKFWGDGWTGDGELRNSPILALKRLKRATLLLKKRNSSESLNRLASEWVERGLERLEKLNFVYLSKIYKEDMSMIQVCSVTEVRKGEYRDWEFWIGHFPTKQDDIFNTLWEAGRLRPDL
ncbi:hypothetical protein H072_6375 [Dactylellina haptotyla CBS 200.50]|uniref:F-box domain-containing protein n=1 Tax=Dactylellina haptotyla (strain CBS 200.50) TaxID=1284197 RepID=S8BX54_DACHA|nr:hypothetical protein H072_6375 [Dactylellina haptotyla CBS 200.50]